ncbi:PglZ domain-containing protein, partial [Escherichia coli]
LAPQAKFFDNHVAPVVKDGRTKAVVIISDGMRYEVAEELASLLRKGETSKEVYVLRRLQDADEGTTAASACTSTSPCPSRATCSST